MSSSSTAVTGHKRKRVELSPLLDSDSDPDEPVRKVPKVDLRRRHWFLTWNNPPEDSKATLLSLGAVKYAFQHETGESGTPHWQGVFSFKDAKRHTALVAACSGAYWAPCRNQFAAKNYCTKLATRSGEVFVKGYSVFSEIVVRDPLEGKTLYPWQQKIVDMLDEEPDERSIYWYWSNSGNLGSLLFVSICV